MRFLRLLSAGKSLMGGEDPVNRYRLPRRQAIPTFGNARNPAVAVAPANTDRPAAEVPLPQPAPFGSPLPAPRSLAKRSWLSRVNPFARDVAVANNASAPAAQTRLPSSSARQTGTGSAPQQAELSLLAVQVVRNDLSDAEDEVPRHRAKGRQLLGRAFPRSPKPVERRGFDEELPIESPPRTVAVGQGRPA